MLPEPQLVKPKAIHRQIGEHVRELIVTGKLAPHVKLPATEELAAAWKTTPKTIQNALGPLVKEGLLTRVPKRGTFVRKRGDRLTCVGIYDTASVGESLYGQAMRAALKEELHRAGIEMDMWVDPRPDEQAAKPWLPFVAAATDREFQALIAVSAPMPQVEWLAKLPVPAAFQSTLDLMPNRVNCAVGELAAISLQALAQQGCRSVGLICPCSTEFNGPKGARSVWTDFFIHFADVARDLGLTVRNEWMRVPLHVGSVGIGSHEQFGHEEFLQLWSQSKRPDGLLAFDDVTARGVILAVRERQVRVPEELKLVLHKNESIDLYCPLPATLVVSSERAMARALIAQVQKQFRGETCEPIYVGFTLSSAKEAVNP